MAITVGIVHLAITVVVLDLWVSLPAGTAFHFAGTCNVAALKSSINTSAVLVWFIAPPNVIEDALHSYRFALKEQKLLKMAKKLFKKKVLIIYFLGM
jgi:hypothetical protein